MFFRQYQLGCLSLFSYLVGDETTGRAVVVDPQRDISQYLEDASAAGLKIERVFETHFHADFLSGHLELAAATGAVISYGEGAEADFPIENVSDGQRLSLGDVVLEVRATPGHTPESISIVLYEHEGSPPWGVLTGDALFIGDVGRPDLLAAGGLTSDELARMLYRSLRDRLLTLPDSTRVFPAHGAGSACGKHMSSASESTIGEQRRTNYALRDMSEDDFVAVVTEGQPTAPLYFAFAADANRREHQLLDDHEPVEVVTVDAVHGALVLDTRSPEVFASGHLRGSINVPLDSRFAEFAGDVIRAGEPIVIVADAGREVEAKVRLARIGFDTVRGAIDDIDRVLGDHPELASTASRVTASDLEGWRAEVADLQLVDVRNPGEQATGVIPGAISAPLPSFLDALEHLEPSRPTVLYCGTGVRSSIAASVLRSKGFTAVADMLGGYPAWDAVRAGV